MHNLMLQGSGLSLGPDCDGVLNFVDEPSAMPSADTFLQVQAMQQDFNDQQV